jgi:hypothetical protein
MVSCCFIVGIKIEKTERNPIVTYLSVYLKDGERVYFIENNFQEQPPFPLKNDTNSFF